MPMTTRTRRAEDLIGSRSGEDLIGSRSGEDLIGSRSDDLPAATGSGKA